MQKLRSGEPRWCAQCCTTGRWQATCFSPKKSESWVTSTSSHSLLDNDHQSFYQQKGILLQLSVQMCEPSSPTFSTWQSYWKYRRWDPGLLISTTAWRALESSFMLMQGRKEGQMKSQSFFLDLLEDWGYMTNQYPHKLKGQVNAKSPSSLEQNPRIRKYYRN